MKSSTFSFSFKPLTAMTLNEDQQELDGLRQLDSQVIGAVYDRYFPVVFRYVRYRVNSEAQAEDIASDVFVRLLEASRAGKGPETNLKAWLLSTASHAVSDHMRRVYRRPTSDLPETLPDKAASIAEDVERRERNGKVRAALSGLSAEQQHVIALRFGQGLSLEETAKIMQKNINAIKQLQFRALAALNRKVEEAL